MKLVSTILKADIPTSTGRIYSKEVVEEAIKNFNETGCKFGSLYKNQYDALTSRSISDISHTVNDLKLENESLICDIDVAETPNGKLVQSLIDNQIPLSMFPRIIIEDTEETIIDGRQITEVKKASIISLDVCLDSSTL